jgi:hypothetical protein
MENLLKDRHPIFMEGVHCTYPLLDKRFADRPCFVRVHNVEYRYYADLARSTSFSLRKMYYWMESRLLKNYEKAIAGKATFWGTTETDDEIYRHELNCRHIEELPLYIPTEWKLSAQEGMGSFCLYHGDLSVDANDKAARWLLTNVFSKLKIPLVIAGKNPSSALQKQAHQQSHTCIVANPSHKELQDMIGKAHINIIPSYTFTGMKLKLLNALFHGRHCIVNDATIAGSGLDAACHISNTANGMAELVAQLYHQPFAAEEITLRKKLLESRFSNEANAKKQVEWIWG